MFECGCPFASPSANKHHIGIKRDRFANELFVRNLAPEIDRFDHFIAFQTEVSGVTLHVHDGVDTDRMRVRPRARPDHSNLRPNRSRIMAFVSPCS